MALHALIRISPITDLNERREFTGSPPDRSGKGLKWIPIVQDPAPVAGTDYDPATQKAVSNVTLSTTALTYGWDIVSQSTEEQDDYQFRQWLQDNRADARAIFIKLKNGDSVTNAEAQRMLYYLAVIAREQVK